MDSVSIDIPEHYSILLVHGTWGRGIFARTTSSRTVSKPTAPSGDETGKRWFEPGSSFRARLVKSLDLRMLRYEIDYFEWSGANSFSERYEAAAALADVIRQTRASSPKSKMVCIGHSHAGNVILLALHLLSAEERDIEVITLATPFIRVFEQRSVSMINKSSALMLALVMLAISFGNLFHLFNAFDSFLQNDYSALIFPLVFLAGVTVLTYFYALLVTGVIWQSRHQPLRKIAFYDLPAMPHVSLLALRGVDDEASFALVFGRLGAKLNSFFLRWIQLKPITIFAITGAFILLLSYLSLNAPRSARYLCLVAIFIFLIGPLISALFRATAGSELMWAGADQEISVNSSPDSTPTFEISEKLPEVGIATLASTRGIRSLRHYIYDSEYCTEAIAVWLNRYRVRAVRAQRAASVRSLPQRSA